MELAVNVDEILRMEEIPGGNTQIIQTDKGPTTVTESLGDILKVLDADVVKVEPPAPPEASTSPKAGQPIGHAHAKAGAR